MNFVNPYFLFASVAVAIPIIIHLFNFRKYKLVYFSNVALLKDIQQETKKTSQLKHLLVLLFRILTIMALVIAFAQPFIPVDSNKKIINAKSNAVSVYIDNSFSMDANTDESTMLDAAKARAREIVSAYTQNDQFQLLTNDFEGKHQLLLSKEEFLDELDKISSSAAVKKMSEVVIRQKDLLATSTTKSRSIFMISDLQKNCMDIQAIKQDTLFPIFVIPIKRLNYANVSIDSCWFVEPIVLINKPIKLNISLSNWSEKEYTNMPVKLMINDVQKAISPITLKPGEKKQLQISFVIQQSGIQSCKVQIDDYPVSFDDAFFFSFHVYNKVNVLHVFESNVNPFINKLFDKDSTANYSTISIRSITSSQLAETKLLILDGLKVFSIGFAQELKRFIEKGGTVLFCPSEGPLDGSQKSFFANLGVSIGQNFDTSSTRIESIDIKNALYNTVFDKIPSTVRWPNVYAYLPVQFASNSQAYPIIILENGLPFLFEHSSGSGKLFAFTSSLTMQSSDFVSHSLFVPTIYQMMILSQRIQSVFYTIGSSSTIYLSSLQLANDDICTIKANNSNWSCIPEINYINGLLQLNVHDQIKVAGNYKVMQDKSIISGISYNYDRRESNPELVSIDDINSNQNKTIQFIDAGKQSLKTYMLELNQGFQLWKYFIIASLVFLLSEIICIRFL